MTSAVVRERPILFSGPMVRAIRAGLKTVTRRIVKPQLKHGPEHGECRTYFVDEGCFDGWVDWDAATKSGRAFSCPFGVPGDRLWVRETFAKATDDYTKTMMSGFIYAADGDTPDPGPDDGPEKCRGNWTPSIFMPRVASRLTLEVHSVSVERLHEITEEDAEREGVENALSSGPADDGARVTIRNTFANLWNRINAKCLWSANPWVWRIEFRMVNP
jgi:hypothetical protein